MASRARSSSVDRLMRVGRNQQARETARSGRRLFTRGEGAAGGVGGVSYCLVLLTLFNGSIS